MRKFILLIALIISITACQEKSFTPSSDLMPQSYIQSIKNVNMLSYSFEAYREIDTLFDGYPIYNETIFIKGKIHNRSSDSIYYLGRSCYGIDILHDTAYFSSPVWYCNQTYPFVGCVPPHGFSYQYSAVSPRKPSNQIQLGIKLEIIPAIPKRFSENLTWDDVEPYRREPREYFTYWAPGVQVIKDAVDTSSVSL